MADQADPFLLYERSVQCPEAEVDFICRWFFRMRNRPARVFREDFCGTAAVSVEWVKHHPENRAIGIDLNAKALDWARAHHLRSLTPAELERIALHQADVRARHSASVDIVNAMNFSYWCFTSRAALREYFLSVYQSLNPDGVFFLDAFGGYDAYRELTEERHIGDGEQRFVYIWDQARFDPVTGSLTCHIHFGFRDDSRLEKAFSYEWRLWSLPEIRELLAEAGFLNITAYWQGWDDDEQPDGIFRPVGSADADAGWICYLSAEKQALSSPPGALCTEP
jgi:SAM-dependent methyltransferase